MATTETKRAVVVRRLEAEGWINKGGANHDVFRHDAKPGIVVVPRHRTLSPGVARSIAKVAGW